MKKILSLFIVLATVVSLHADSKRDRERFITRLETCEAILREFQADPALAIPADVLQSAKAIVITTQIRGGLILGMQEGYGTILVKKSNGSWSIPVVIRAGEASLGLQLGGSRIENVYVIMNAETPRQLFEGRFNIGVDAAAVAGPRVADSEKTNRQLLSVPVLVYSNQKGLFAGATVKTGYITRSDSVNRAYYGVDYDLPELLYGNFVTPVPTEVHPLIDYVTQLSP
ncbi:lipid-binding SYLF domain-containing protein [Rariglobus hedericola]|uniref:Lipid-binding SYLF domain-containing protein n=1 Tax=Rariglobus hedericola TaxID=2597822 RepID=A0A556QIV0_9BACT|nr:lipid-binding SYLF domain-containing protein [Rariglobus hedericola]TSJ76573.1 lipid-binding SYLF domain-containing protein [Rariglobus hedericola]